MKTPKPIHRIRPFSNGGEYRYWREHNCERCTQDYNPETKETYCQSELELSMACVGDGLVSQQVAERLGLPGNLHCPDITPKNED